MDEPIGSPPRPLSHGPRNPALELAVVWSAALARESLAPSLAPSVALVNGSRQSF